MILSKHPSVAKHGLGHGTVFLPIPFFPPALALPFFRPVAPLSDLPNSNSPQPISSSSSFPIPAGSFPSLNSPAITPCLDLRAFTGKMLFPSCCLKGICVCRRLSRHSRAPFASTVPYPKLPKAGKQTASDGIRAQSLRGEVFPLFCASVSPEGTWRGGGEHE